MNTKQIQGIGFLLLTFTADWAFAQPPGMHHGMHEEHRGSMMDQHGPRSGYGHRYGNSGAMMSEHMMGGPMMGMMGMMGMKSFMADLRGLKLSKEQSAKIRKLHRDVRKGHLTFMAQSMDISDKLQDLYAEAVPDAAKIGKVYGELFDIRRQMIEQHITLRNKVFALLTKEQQAKAEESESYYGRHHMMNW